MLQNTRTIRIFISSTFADFIEERNALQEKVYPRLRALCEIHGARFQAVDLRWGISHGDAQNQETMQICLSEIKRSQSISPRPNFAILIGDRFGWQPIPEHIPSEEMRLILEHLDMQQGALSLQKQLLEEWYKCDDNFEPSIYILQQRSNEFRENGLWTETERHIGNVLRSAARRMDWHKLDITNPKRWRYFVSATGQEIIHGALSVSESSKNVLCFNRSIIGVTADTYEYPPSDYFDIDSETKQKDEFAYQGLSDIKDSLKRHIPESNIYSYTCKWNPTSTEGSISLDHIERLCNDFYEGFKSIIMDELSGHENINSFSLDPKLHEEFAKKQCRQFRGRGDLLQEFLGHYNDVSTRMLIIDGKSGSGKSALIAKICELIGNQHPNVKVIKRFIGITPLSTDPLFLVDSLTDEISQKFGLNIDNETNGSDLFQNRLTDIKHLLSSAAKVSSIVIILDAINMLKDKKKTYQFLRVFLDIPKGVKIIISTNQLEINLLKFSLSSAVKVMVMPALEIGDALEIFSLWLNEYEGSVTIPETRKRLQLEQMEYLINQFRSDPTPLYLRLVFEKARNWHSWDLPGHEPVFIANKIEKVIEQYLEKLEIEHGKILVSKALSYLTVARDGLAENELIDVLSKDREVMEEYHKRHPNSPISNNLPIIVYSRLFLKLQPYLSEQISGDIGVMRFFHTYFADACNSRYINEKISWFHSQLAHYYSSQPICYSTSVNDVNRIVYNNRKLIELPYHLINSGMSDDLFNLIINLKFIEAKCSTGMIYDLMNDFKRSLDTEGLFTSEKANVLQEFDSWIKRQAHILKEYSNITFQQAFNEPYGAVMQVANKELLNQPPGTSFLKLINKPGKKIPIPVVLEYLLDSPKQRPVLCAFSPDGNKIAAVMINSSMIKIWDTYTGQLKDRIVIYSNKKSARVRRQMLADHLAFSSDGKQIILGYRGFLRIIDIATERTIEELPGYLVKCFPHGWGRVYEEEGLLKCQKAIAGNSSLLSLKPNDHLPDVCAMNPDELVCVYDHKAVEIWNLINPECKLHLSFEIPIHADAGYFKSSGIGNNRFVLVFSNKAFIINLNSGEFVRTFFTQKGGNHIWEIVDKCWLSSDGMYIATSSYIFDDIKCDITEWRISVGNVTDDIPIFSFVFNDKIKDLSFSQEGDRIAILTKNDITLFDLCDQYKQDWSMPVELVAFSKNTKELLLMSPLYTDNSCSYYECNILEFRNADDFELNIEKSLVEDIRAFLYFPNGRNILATGRNHNANNLSMLCPEDYVNDIEYYEKLIGSHDREILDFAISSDGKRVVSIDGYDVKLWDISLCENILCFDGNSAESCSYCSNEQIIISYPGNIGVYDSSTGKEEFVLHFDKEQFCSCSSDGSRVVTIQGKLINVWDIVERRKEVSLVGHNGTINYGTLFPCGNLLASVSNDKSLNIWDINSQEIIMQFIGETPMCKVFIRPDGLRIAAIDINKKLYYFEPIFL